MVGIFDTHAHYDSRQYAEDREEVLKRVHETVDCIINSGADMKSSHTSLELALEYDHIYASVGVHPDSAGELAFCEKRDVDASSDEEPEFIPKEDCLKNREELERLCDNERTVAVGEIGLDYHWNVWPKDIQQEAFKWQWELALKKDLPIVIHSRDAAEDTLKVVREMFAKYGKKPLKADMHCYSYSVELAEEYLKMGLMFGIGGVVTFKNSKKLKEVVDMLPLERILLETDCPYMAPDPFRGKRNDSSLLSLVAEKIAEIKGVEARRIYEQTRENARGFFTRVK